MAPHWPRGVHGAVTMTSCGPPAWGLSGAGPNDVVTGFGSVTKQLEDVRVCQGADCVLVEVNEPSVRMPSRDPHSCSSAASGCPHDDVGRAALDRVEQLVGLFTPHPQTQSPSLTFVMDDPVLDQTREIGIGSLLIASSQALRTSTAHRAASFGEPAP